MILLIDKRSHSYILWIFWKLSLKIVSKLVCHCRLNTDYGYALRVRWVEKEFIAEKIAVSQITWWRAAENTSGRQ